MTVKKDFSLFCLFTHIFLPYKLFLYASASLALALSVCTTEVCPRDLQEYVIVVNEV